jgi:hypothetical protein
LPGKFFDRFDHQLCIIEFVDSRRSLP